MPKVPFYRKWFVIAELQFKPGQATNQNARIPPLNTLHFKLYTVRPY